MPTFIRPVEPFKIHYCVQLHQNLTSGFQVLVSFLVIKIALKIRVQGQISQNCNRFCGSP